MTCDCKHSQDGRCRRFPPVRTVENGRNVWQFPPADAECGERLRDAEPAFKMEPPEPTNATCPVCGRGFMTNPKRAHVCCSLSCAGKMKWIRRKA